MKTIPLTKGMSVIVDDEDFEFLTQWEWHASKSKDRFYARRDEFGGRIRKKIYMHRVIAGANHKERVDHKNRNALDNQRHNLRTCTQVQNMGNCGMQSTNTSGFKGVSWSKGRRKWRACISDKPRGCIYLGYYSTALEAAIAYDTAAERKYGEFALTNAKMGLLPVLDV